MPPPDRSLHWLPVAVQNILPTGPFTTSLDQVPLPYRYDALEPVIDAKTMEIHYTKHAAAYSTNLKDAVKAEGLGDKVSVEEILGKVSKYSPKMRNNSGGHYNHEMFWQSMKAKW